MGTSDHTVYINDKTYLATCLHSLLTSLMRAVRLPPCKVYLKVIKKTAFLAVWTSFYSELEIAHATGKKKCTSHLLGFAQGKVWKTGTGVNHVPGVRAFKPLHMFLYSLLCLRKEL